LNILIITERTKILRDWGDWGSKIVRKGAKWVRKIEERLGASWGVGLIGGFWAGYVPTRDTALSVILNEVKDLSGDLMVVQTA
jgi:hypothetical protein